MVGPAAVAHIADLNLDIVANPGSSLELFLGRFALTFLFLVRLLGFSLTRPSCLAVVVLVQQIAKLRFNQLWLDSLN